MANVLELINVFEVADGGETRHFLCFLEAELGLTKGIDSREVIGRVEPGPAGGFDPTSLVPNPAFVETLARYMNEEAARSPEVAREAMANPSGWVYVIDPRQDDPDAPVPPANILGCFAADDAGQVVPDSFQYNRNHRWVDPVRGVSGVLRDRAFYDWLHPNNS
jgi:hypothetical protein